MEDDATKFVQKYAEKPFKFIEDYLGIKLHWYQKLWMTICYRFTKYIRL